MKLISLKSIKGIWFFLEVLFVFISIQVIEYSFGHFDAGTIAIISLVTTACLFIVALLIPKYRDKKQSKRSAVGTVAD